MGISAKFCPFFGHFRSKGPSVLLLELAREVMMGPRTGNAQKMGKTRQKYPFFNSTIEINRNLNISMLHIVLWHFFHIGPKPVFRYPIHH